MTLKGSQILNGHETFVLEAPAAGNPKRWYFDNKSGLLLRAETRNSSGKTLDSVDYDNYAMVDGIQEPFSIRLVDRDGTDFNIKLSEVKHNILIEDASFEKPKKQSRDTASANTPRTSRRLTAYSALGFSKNSSSRLLTIQNAWLHRRELPRKFTIVQYGNVIHAAGRGITEG